MFGWSNSLPAGAQRVWFFSLPFANIILRTLVWYRTWTRFKNQLGGSKAARQGSGHCCDPDPPNSLNLYRCTTPQGSRVMTPALPPHSQQRALSPHASPLPTHSQRLKYLSSNIISIPYPLLPPLTFESSCQAKWAERWDTWESASADSHSS